MFVHYNREFVKTEFDCRYIAQVKEGPVVLLLIIKLNLQLRIYIFQF
jgi:hypothetical protein